jgi:hypothetical protein
MLKMIASNFFYTVIENGTVREHWQKKKGQGDMGLDGPDL